MTVKELLKKQDASFISLHELLTKMTQSGDGATYQEAAVALYRIVEPEHFLWRVSDPVKGVKKATDREEKKAINSLEMAARFEKNHPVWSIDDDIPF